jgi:hypothetical protein
MTLGLGLIARDYCCVVSDRRTSFAGMPLDDEFDKTCFLRTADARLALTFAGLASANRYHSKVRLIENLKACAAPDFWLVDILGRMTEVMNKDFLGNKDIRGIPNRYRAFSLMMFGFKLHQGFSIPFFGLISNYIDFEKDDRVAEPWKEFRQFVGPLPPKRPSFGFAIGFEEALDATKMSELAESASRLKPTSAILKLVNLVKDASKHRSRVIGGQVTSIMIPYDFTAEVMADYHVSTPQRSIYLPAQVFAQPPGAKSINSNLITSLGSNPPIAIVPQVGRNKLCPCESRLRYKHCHSPKNNVEAVFRSDASTMPDRYSSGQAPIDLDAARAASRKRRKSWRRLMRAIRLHRADRAA